MGRGNAFYEHSDHLEKERYKGLGRLLVKKYYQEEKES